MIFKENSYFTMYAQGLSHPEFQMSSQAHNTSTTHQRFYSKLGKFLQTKNLLSNNNKKQVNRLNHIKIDLFICA